MRREEKFKEALECLLAMEGISPTRVSEFTLVHDLASNIRIYATSTIFSKPKRFAVVTRGEKYKDFRTEDILFAEVLLNYYFDEFIYYFPGSVIARYDGAIRKFIEVHKEKWPLIKWITTKTGVKRLCEQPYREIPLTDIPACFVIFEPVFVPRPKKLSEALS